MSTHIISTSEMFEYTNESRLRRLHILSKNGWERVEFYNILAFLPLAPHFYFFLVIFPRGWQHFYSPNGCSGPAVSALSSFEKIWARIDLKD